MRLQVSFYLLNKLCFPVIRMVFPAFEAFQGSLTKNLQELNNPEVQTPRPKHRAGTEPRRRGRGGGRRRGHPRVGRVCAGTALPAPPERRGFGGTGTTLRPLFGALLLAPPPFCEGLSPSHTRTCGSVTQPHGTTAAPGAAPALTAPLPAGVPPIPAQGDATPERPAGLGGSRSAPESLEPSRGSRRGRAARPSLVSAG